MGIIKEISRSLDKLGRGSETLEKIVDRKKLEPRERPKPKDSIFRVELDQNQLAEGAKNEFTEIRLNPKQMREMQDLFDLFDIDDSGSISKRELRTVLSSLGEYPTEEMLDQMMTEFDEDGNEVIDFDEFLAMVVKYNANVQVDPKLELSNALRVFDKKESGIMSAEDIVKILTKNGEEPVDEAEVHEFLEMIRLTNDATVKLEDFAELLTREIKK
ncbi:unnamed protein product [Oikopleura dioica]|uniref:EF-hand domain-containing protein n=1 Tax=Oikopleura dioica TaxID=34765 RepID=E4Y7L5_OIKDI|nr:unnamed protein product [Oikopleura dioica]